MPPDSRRLKIQICQLKISLRIYLWLESSFKTTQSIHVHHFIVKSECVCVFIWVSLALKENIKNTANAFKRITLFEAMFWNHLNGALLKASLFFCLFSQYHFVWFKHSICFTDFDIKKSILVSFSFIFCRSYLFKVSTHTKKKQIPISLFSLHQKMLIWILCLRVHSHRSIFKSSTTPVVLAYQYLDVSELMKMEWKMRVKL